jgi:hypothetical protein
MNGLIFVCFFINFAVGIFLVCTAKSTFQILSGAVCLMVSSMFFIGGALLYKLDKLIVELKKEKK